jgi:hypothetical protein
VALSTHARDQSIWSASPKRFRRVWCNLRQTPALCQSRRRRQQVIPEPQPISWGSISQGIPVLSTNRMPARQARSGMRGRPPLGLGFFGGSNGWMVVQSSSLTSSFAILPFYPSEGGFVRRSKSGGYAPILKVHTLLPFGRCLLDRAETLDRRSPTI